MNTDWLNLHPDTVDHPGMWDDTFLRELLDGVHGPVPTRGRVVVVPGRFHADDVAEVNRWINRYDAVLVIVTADEESVFPIDDLEHERMVVWAQTVRPGRYDRHVVPFPIGYPPDTRGILAHATDPSDPPGSHFYFAGQDTHQRRHDAIEALTGIAPWLVTATPGFTLGIPRSEYLREMSRAMTAPCPSGPATQETFRMWEALQAGAIPILDRDTPDRVDDGYWRAMFGPDEPLPVIADWSDVGSVIDRLVAAWPHASNMVQAWWSRWRRGWASRLTHTIDDLEGDAEAERGMWDDRDVTVLVPTSPVRSNPDTSIIEETIESIRDRLPNAEIRIMFDGVRAEQWEMTGAYHEYTRRVLWLINRRWRHVTGTVHEVHRHQHQMTRHELASVVTPTILFVEHDCPLTGGWPVEALLAPIQAGAANMVRMNHEHEVLPDHRHLLVDPDPAEYPGGAMFYRTMQWSQRPHFALTSVYHIWLDTRFTPDERSMIEDRMHGVVQGYPWGRHKILLYAPGGNEQRSIHRDARGSDPKWVTS